MPIRSQQTLTANSNHPCYPLLTRRGHRSERGVVSYECGQGVEEISLEALTPIKRGYGVHQLC